MLHTYNLSLANAFAAYAEASSPNGPFGPATLMASPYTTQVGTLTGGAGELKGTTTITSLRLNEPYLAFKAGEAFAEIVTPIAQSGTSVTFDLPLGSNFSDSDFAHVAAKTIDPSIIWRNDDGTWEGIFTAYKALEIVGEYTVRMKAPEMSGPWVIVSGKVVFQPYGSGNQRIN